MNKLLVIFAFILSFSASAQSNLGTIRGVIHDHETGEVVIYCKVIVLNEDSVAVTGAYSDFDGFFFIHKIKPGTYTVQIEEIEHITKVIENIVVEPGKTTTLKEVILKKEELPKVEIHRYKNMHDNQ